MNYTIVGLGNPGQEYEWTRHNTGHMIVDAFAKLVGVEEWTEDKKLNSLVAKTKVGKNTATLIKPNTFMNKSGNAVAPIIKSKKAAETLVVIHDDLDIPFGKIKMSFNKSAGGHKGVVSIVKAIKTEGFIRLRVGISPASSSGKIKKPQGEEAVVDLILGKFKPAEQITFKKLAKVAAEGLEILLKDGREVATGFVNSQ
jgi:PTH1 family peptidyl-tRNA hydrolase